MPCIMFGDMFIMLIIIIIMEDIICGSMVFIMESIICGLVIMAIH